MKNLKKYTILLLALFSLILLTGCGSPDGEWIDTNEIEDYETEIDLSVYKGIWLADADNQFDYIEFDEDGYWRLYSGENEIDEGCLEVSEDNTVVLSSYLDGAIDGGEIEAEGDRIYINTAGYFNYAEGMENYWYITDGPEDEPEDNRYIADEPEDEPEDNRSSADKSENTNKNNQSSTVKTEDYDGAYDWNEKLEQRNVSHFEGTWYLDAELWSLNYIVIDGSGNWSYYQRPTEDDEGTEMDCGTLTYSTDEERAYYAESDLYDGLRFKVVEFVEGILVWGDDGTYYLMDGTEYDSYDWNPKLHQVNVSHFEGVWYYDYDPSADTYVIIDGDGNWSFYQRSSGNDDASVIDYGTLTYSPDEDSMYYADSAVNDGVRYKVFWFDDKILVWGDEGAYYLMD